MMMNADEIKKIAYSLYWAHSRDISGLSDADGSAVLEELEKIRRREDKANEILERRFCGDIYCGYKLGGRNV